MKLPTLFSKTARGQTQVWEIEIDHDRYRTHEGLLGGAITTSNWTVCEGKNTGRANATTNAEQAIKDATSKWTKKAKHGYAEDINQAGCVEYPECMLALKYKDFSDRINFANGLILQYKLNGGRLLANKNGLWTRKGERYKSIPHIEAALKPFFEQYPNALLDGEAFNAELRQHLNKLMSIIRKTKDITDEVLKESQSIVQFHIYDGYDFDSNTGPGVPYIKRLAKIREVVAPLEYCKCIESHMVYTPEAVTEFFDKVTGEGHEGIMVRNPHAGYTEGRTKDLLKLKPEDDDEFIIVNVVEGEGNRSGMAGKVICQMTDGRTFGANMKGETSKFVEVLTNKENYIGKVATITFNGYTGKGIPNYAQFDVNNWQNSQK